jgi:aspartate 1-decarboxylase
VLRTMMKSKIHRATVTQADLQAELRSYAPRVVFVDAANRIAELGADPAHAPAGSGLVSGTVSGPVHGAA